MAINFFSICKYTVMLWLTIPKYCEISHNGETQSILSRCRVVTRHVCKHVIISTPKNRQDLDLTNPNK